MLKFKSYTTLMVQWMKAVECMLIPAKKLPGKWRLYEYYTEPEGELVNIKEDQIKTFDFYWEINFGKDGNLTQSVHLPVRINTQEYCCWDIERNYLILYGSDQEPRSKFQYAVSNDQLKLLEKFNDGRINFFGFFKRVNEA